MQLLEHQAKALAAAAGVAIPDGALAWTSEQAGEIARRLGGRVAVKAQVAIGGRDKAGGVRLVPASQAARAAHALLGGVVRGQRVESVLVERVIESVSELYLAVTVMPSAASAVLLVSSRGGVDVESRPDSVATVAVSAFTGLRPWHVRTAAVRSGLPASAASSLIPVAAAAYRLFTERRAVLVEINPLIISPGGGMVAVDVRIVPAHPAPGRDASRSDLTQRDHGFDFVELDRDGLVGLVSTGAGASMLLVDLLAEAGAAPANFCDLRAGGMRGDPARLITAFDQLRSYPRLRCIAVNVFAGLTDLAEFAALLVIAYQRAAPSVPVLVRIEGRGAEKARRLICDAGLSCPETLEALTDEVVRVAGIEPRAETHA